jgi:hypothetical protein
MSRLTVVVPQRHSTLLRQAISRAAADHLGYDHRRPYKLNVPLIVPFDGANRIAFTALVLAPISRADDIMNLNPPDEAPACLWWVVL